MATKITLILLLTILVLNTSILTTNPKETRALENAEDNSFHEVTSSLNIDFKHTFSKTITVPEDHPTIQAAVNAANPGDTIFVHNGTYKEHLTIDKTITLIGQNKSITIIDGNGMGTPLTITAPNVTVTEFTIKSGPTKPPSPPLSGIHINSTGNAISSNIITENDFYGIGLTHHGNNTIKQNIITNNTVGIFLLNSNNNTIYHNNLINNLDNTETPSSYNNTWDNGYPSGGNHWSDYTGEDEHSGQNQDEPGSDTIGDTSYKIDENNQDNYPLINPWTVEPAKTFAIGFENKTYHVSTESNSTITHFQFSQPQKQISFNVTGPSNTTGFCNITIPKNVLRGDPWTITIDNKTTINFAQDDNETHTSLHFTYELQGTRHIKIRGTWAIPDFPSIITLLLFIITLTAAILTRRVKPKNRTSPKLSLAAKLE